MNKTEFKTYVIQHLDTFLNPEDTPSRVEIREVMKEDGIREAFVINPVSGESCPNIYIEPFYKKYIDNGEIDEIVGMIAATYTAAKIMGSDTQVLDDNFQWDVIQDRIIPVFTHLGTDEEYFSDKPCGERAGLKYIYKYISPDESMQVAITHQMLHHFDVSEEELKVTALHNLYWQANYESTIEKMRKMLPKGVEDPFSEVTIDDDTFILSRIEGERGASVVLNPGFMSDLLLKMGQDEVWIIPSSIHEMIAAPLKYGDALEISKWIRETNDNCLEPMEILSYHVFKYSEADGLVEVM